VSAATGQQKLSAGAATGVLGGTFDPVHFGHLRAAVEAAERLELDDLRLLPAGVPPHRAQPVASATQRIAMLRLAISNCAALQVDDREVRRPGSSFMVDTLASIRSEIGNSPLLLLVGQDAANELDTWHRWRDLFDLAHLVVMRRPDAHFSCRAELSDQIERRRIKGPTRLRQAASGFVLSLEVTQLDISSTLIRESFGAGRSPRFLMPDEVIDYVRRQHLYGAA
jgi:nicotinate-nucleotide adenylyltransferase